MTLVQVQDPVVDTLPEAVAERVRPLRPVDRARAGEFVLYWMHSSLRGHENPALDAALYAGRALGRPVLVYHGLSERYPYASDRIHRFVIESARDVAAELRARGVQYAFHLERPEHRAPALLALAARAALVVTDEMPIEPQRRWVQSLYRHSQAPLWCVDGSCVVPMRALPRSYDRAFAFERAVQPFWEKRLRRPWEEAPSTTHAPIQDLPFAPVELERADVAALVAACEIDHSVGPVPHTRGGSVAGYARWDAFRARGLGLYHRVRNDAARDGVSRMSAYLHFGAVSPLRIAREVAALSGDGPAKFLNELLVWRELAWHWCFRAADPAQLSALPGWAQETLRAHARDPRPAHYSWETLARGTTGHALWDLCQRSLLQHGELHNNVRMTWGKALLSWTRSPQEALQRLIDLNHRYALDGRDPSSYGGLLWCLGLFDRPFEPASPIAGTVRPRPLGEHEARLDLEAYRARVSRPLVPNPPRIAVIGAGIAGLHAARALADHGLPVVVFDKARGAGGRLATRREGPWSFDHGAQYFTARDERFARYASSWVEDGHIAPWPQAPAGESPQEPRYVGLPGMSGLAKHLAAGLSLQTGARVTSLQRERGGWRLLREDRADLGHFARVLVTAPAPQTRELLEDAAPALAARAAAASYSPCWAVMVAFAEPLAAPDALRSTEGPIAWAARNASKPGRPTGDAWVLHASPAWSREHLEAPAEEVARLLVSHFTAAKTAPPVVLSKAHRWRYALVETALGAPCLYDDALGLGAAGDWCLGPRVELAWHSGGALAGRVLGGL